MWGYKAGGQMGTSHEGQLEGLDINLKRLERY